MRFDSTGDEDVGRRGRDCSMIPNVDDVRIDLGGGDDNDLPVLNGV